MVKIDIAAFKTLDHFMSALYIVLKCKHFDPEMLTRIINSVLIQNFCEQDISNFITLISLYPNNFGVEFILKNNIQEKLDNALKIAESKSYIFLSPAVKCVVCNKLLCKGNSVIYCEVPSNAFVLKVYF